MISFFQYTIVFTSEDYDSDEPNVGVTSPEKIVEKIENRAKVDIFYDLKQVVSKIIILCSLHRNS